MKRLVLALALLSPMAALGQAVVGQGIVDGKIIEILSDKTWRYAAGADATAPHCQLMDGTVSFCADGSAWQATTALSAEADGSFVKDGSYYGMLIVDRFGTEAGISPQMMRDAVLQNARRATPVEPTVISVTPVTVDGQQGETIVFLTAYNGASLVFSDTTVIGATQSLQIITYTLGKVYAPDQVAAHEEFVAQTRIAAP